MDRTQAVTIAGIELQGGYYPLKYDGRLATDVQSDTDIDLGKALMGGKVGKAATRNGHLKERAASSGKPILLEMSVLHSHVAQTIHDLEMSEAIANAWRVLHNAGIRSDFINSGRQADFEALELCCSIQLRAALSQADWMNAMARRMKSGFTMSKLAFNLATALSQVGGLGQSAVVVGKSNMLYGIQQSFRGSAREDVLARSSFMRSRSGTFNKDINDFFASHKDTNIQRRGARVREIVAKAASG